MQKAIRYSHRNTYRLILDALFAALYLVLAAFVSIRTPFAKLSFSSLPLLLAAYLFGPADALLVATVGAFLEQVQFGLGPTSPLWMLPAILMAGCAGVLGLAAKTCAEKGESYYNLLIPATLIAEILFTATNTAALYLDGYLMHYSVKALTVLLPPRLANLGVRTVVTTVTVRLLLPRVQKMMSKRNDS